jgi:hypothetical protein
MFRLAPSAVAKYVGANQRSTLVTPSFANYDSVEVFALTDQFSSSHDPDSEKRILGSWHYSVHGACLDCETGEVGFAIEIESYNESRGMFAASTI